MTRLQSNCDAVCVTGAADIVREVEKSQKRFPRPKKEITKMYLEAIAESASCDDAITNVAFHSVASHYQLGLPFVDPSRCVLPASANRDARSHAIYSAFLEP